MQTHLFALAGGKSHFLLPGTGDGDMFTNRNSLYKREIYALLLDI